MRSAFTVARVLHEKMLQLTNDLDFTPSLDVTDEMLILKSSAVAAAKSAVEHAMEAVGGRGFFRSTGLEQVLRDVSAGHFHPLPAKQQVRFTGRRALGLDPIG
jgi:alkylation response protein AidB-like acyl-CoA dehydrogenase